MDQEVQVKPSYERKKALANGALFDPLTLEEFRRSLQYFHVPELKVPCKKLNIPSNEKKPGLINQILTFLHTGAPLPLRQNPALSKAERGVNYPLSPEVRMLEGAFKNDAKTRNFLKELIGPHFHYTVFGLDWLKERWHQGLPPTYQEFADFWQSAYLARKNQRNALKDEWAYLNFARQFADENPHSSKKDLLSAWKKMREQEVQKAKKILEEIGYPQERI